MDVKATINIEAAVFAVRAAKQKIKLLEKQLKENVEIVKAFMESNDADTLLSEAGNAIIGTLDERGGNPRLDIEKFKLEYPNIYEKFLIQTEKYKVFQVK